LLLQPSYNQHSECRGDVAEPDLIFTSPVWSTNRRYHRPAAQIDTIRALFIPTFLCSLQTHHGFLSSHFWRDTSDYNCPWYQKPHGREGSDDFLKHWSAKVVKLWVPGESISEQRNVFSRVQRSESPGFQDSLNTGYEASYDC
jgi:hypothetical protein